MSNTASASSPETADLDREQLAARYAEVRARTEALCSPLETEDYVVQSMPDASPAKWHLAHTSWFFEAFILAAEAPGGPGVSSVNAYLFNSYYNALGERIPRPQRGLLSRPTVAEVYRYRQTIDARMRELLENADEERLRRIGKTVVLGLNHEQQHQELILTDLKHAFGSNPVRPVYRNTPAASVASATVPIDWCVFSGGLVEIGHDEYGFAYDNESPRHRVYLEPFLLADRLVTNGEYLGFLEDGGYDRPELWLSDGWNARNTLRWTAPLYWERNGDRWQVMTLGGMLDLNEDEPVCHVSDYEADAYARWAGARLPTEAEWETAASSATIDGNFVESERLHPAGLSASRNGNSPVQLFGDVWEWTASPYTPYPGYRPAAGALGEYNGKFMCNQIVLRGGSCVTPRSHIRATYRNFFPPEASWQFSGIRLAKAE